MLSVNDLSERKRFRIFEQIALDSVRRQSLQKRKSGHFYQIITSELMPGEIFSSGIQQEISFFFLFMQFPRAPESHRVLVSQKSEVSTNLLCRFAFWKRAHICHLKREATHIGLITVNHDNNKKQFKRFRGESSIFYFCYGLEATFKAHSRRHAMCCAFENE